MKRILITGGLGFVGKNLIRYWLDRRYAIRVFDDLSVGGRGNMPSSDIEIIIGDIQNRDQIEMACQNVHAVVHLAAHTNVMESLQYPIRNFEINVHGLQMVLESCRKMHVKKFIFASSNASVGEQDPPIDEGKVPIPISPYGANKLYGEALCSAYFHSYGIQTIALRFANVYGPLSDHKTSVVASVIRRIVEGENVAIYGDGQQTRDFVHVIDICQAIDRALQSNVGGEVFQIGTGIETSIVDVMSILCEAASHAGYPTVKLHYENRRPGEILRNFSDIAKAKVVLGYSPSRFVIPHLRAFALEEFNTLLSPVGELS
jgi:UDP-glucose 4-epimerase